MVIASVVTDVLNRVLGNYVVNLDSKQLNIGIWGGDVVLRNLRLRENAFDALDLPIILTYGFLGELVLKIPWKNLYSQPVIAHISDLYILVSPKETVEYDASKEEKYEMEAKFTKLNNIDLARKMELNLDQPKANKNFVEKLTALIINNLQIKIANVHLRYEDSVTMGIPCALGLTLYNLQLYTTDETWNRSFISEPTGDLCKIADLDSLCAYMNCNKSSLYGENMFDVKELFETNIASQEQTPKDYNYIVGPISVHAKLKLNMNPENSDPPFSSPKVQLLLEMKKLNMGITTTQFRYIFRLSQDMNRMQLAMPYRKYRPFNISYTGHSNKWWKFAITSILEETVRRRQRNWSWDHIKNHRQLYHKYYDMYIAKESSAKPSKDIIDTCDALEKQLDLFNLILIRNQCYMQVDKIKQSQEKTVTTSNSWFGGWSIWGGNADSKGKTDDIQSKLVSAMTADEKGQLYDAIGFHESVTDITLPASYEAIKMKFNLAALEIGLYDDDLHSEEYIEKSNMKTVLLLRLDSTHVNIKQRPGSKAIKIMTLVKGLKATGLQSSEGIPVLITSSTDGSDINLLDVMFEINPLDKKCDKRLNISAKPIEIIYDSNTILYLLKAFKPPKSFDFSKLEEATLYRMSNLKEQSVAGMKYMIDKHEFIELDILLMPIIVKIPEKGKYIKNECSMIVLSLGQFTLVTEPRQDSRHQNLGKSQSETQDLMHNMLNLAYDKFNIKIADIQLLVVKSKEAWRNVLEEDQSSEMYVLHPTSFICDFSMSIIEDDPRLPKTKINVLLPSVHINFADSRIYEAINIITSIPLPESEESEEFSLGNIRSSDLKISTLSLQKMFQAMSPVESEDPDAGLQEIVQYTDLEAQFTLKEFKVTLYKTFCNDTSSDNSSEYETPLDEIAPDEIDENKEPIKFLELNIISLEVEAVKRTYELGASVRLGAITLDQFDIFDGKENTLSIIDTPKFTDIKEYLFIIMYMQADRNSPEFVSKYHSVAQSVTLNFSSLVITLHQECLLNIINIANEFQIKLESILKTDTNQKNRTATIHNSSLTEKLGTILEENEGNEENSLERDTNKKLKSLTRKSIVDQIKFKVNANVDLVSIKLTCRKRDIAEFKIKEFEAGLILKSSYTEFTLLLKDILIIDSNPESIHSIIVQVIGQNALNCKLILYDLEETANYNNNDMKIEVMVGCIEIIFLNWFVSSILTFVNNFQNALEVFANAASFAEQNVVDVYKKTTRMKFNIKIKAPVIIVPTNSKSLNGLALDLGFLDIQNFATESYDKENNQAVYVVDEIKLELKELKLTTIKIIQKETSIKLINERENSKERKYTNVLDPINLTLSVKRNLSNEWYHKIPDIVASGVVKSIDLNIYGDDYHLIMLILDKNLSEGQNEFEEIVQPKKSVTKVEINKISSKPIVPVAITPFAPPKKNQSLEQLKFNFQFEGVLVNLIESDENHLAKTGINFLSIKGRKLIDGTLSVSLVLCDIFVDDTRSSSKNKINQYIKRKDTNNEQIVEEYLKSKEEGGTVPDSNIKYMLDLTVMMKPDDLFVECRVSGFDLILSIEFLMKISEFFITTKDQIPVVDAATFNPEFQMQKSLPNRESLKLETPPTVEKTVKFIVHLNQPDIILVENLNDLNAHAIIFNMLSSFSYRSIGEKQLVYGSIDQLKMFMCSFAPELREQTMHYIIHPCSITLQGSTPEGQGLHISLNVSDVIINVSPATIDLFNQAISSISTSATDKIVEIKTEKDHSDIWDAQVFKGKEFWFTKIDKAYEAVEIVDLETSTVKVVKPEKCIIDIPSIIIIFETGLGYYTTPMLCLETKMSGVASNWSSQLSIEGKLNLFINYYNLELAIWEPFIELNERLNKNKMPEYGPWELNFFLNVGSKEKSEDALTKIRIESDDILELTLTKTSYNLLMTLSDAFSKALDVKGLQKPEFTSPFVCINETGFDMNIDFTKGIFILHDCHIPSKQVNESLNASVIIRSNKNSNQIYADEIKACTVSASGRVYLKSKMLTECLDPSQLEYNLHIRIGEIDKDLVFPVAKADKRYFPLCRDTNQEPWGVISQVISEFGTTKILVHGVVIIKNHFEQNISVHRNNQKGEKILVGEIKPNEKFYVPLHAIYANPKELYFSLKNYNISEQGIKWNDTLTDLDFTKQINCVNIRGRDIFNLNVVREKKEVYQEYTSKFTISSSYYIFHLRPPLYLCNALPIPIKVSISNCTIRRPSVTEAIEAEEKKDEAEPKECVEYGETNIKPGAVLHLPTVKLDAKPNQAKNYVVVRLIDYLEKDWSCTTEVSETHHEFETWIFSSYDSVEKMDLELSVRFEKRHGSLMVTLFSPFWMINKTGLMICYKTFAESVKTLYHPPSYVSPILCSFRQKGFFDKKHTSIRVDYGPWSDKIPLDVAGSNGLVVCEGDDDLMKYKIGVQNHLTHNSLTKQITFIPYYMAINKCSYAIEIQENTRPGDPWIKIEPNECAPYWPKADKNSFLIVRIFGEKQITVPFHYNEGHCTLLKLDKNSHGGINVDVQVNEGCIHITFTSYTSGLAPGLLINHTKATIIIWEKGNVNEKTLKPNQKLLFTWSDPIGEKVILWKDDNNTIEFDLRRDGVGQFTIPKHKQNKKAYWVSFLDGLQRVLLFTEKEAIASAAESSASLQEVTQEIEICLHGIGISIFDNATGNDLVYMGITNSGVIWESKKKGKKYYKQMKIAQNSTIEAKYQQYLNDMEVGAINKYYLDDSKQEINFNAMTLFKSGDREIQRTFYPGIWLQLKTSSYQTQFHFKINRIQIDNQLTDCIFPVILAPLLPPKSIANTTILKPFIECSVVQRIVPNSNVKQFKYCSMLIQEVAFKVDIIFLMGLTEMFASDVTDEQSAKLFNLDVDNVSKSLSELIASHSLQEQKHFYDNLHLGPIKIHLSFSMAGVEPTQLPGILSTIIQTVGVTLTDVNDVVFRLAFFEREYQFYTQSQLMSEAITHYTGQALKQLYVLVFGLDVLGNPYGLVVGISKGVEDLFYEPFQGAIQGPGEFAEGVVLGVKSLFGHTVGGAAGAVSKITGAMGKGLAALTFDKDYQRKRRQAMNKKPTNFQEGIARSSKGLVTGVYEGVTGVFTKPFSGAKQDGVGGFFKGLGKGAIGLVAHPTAGVVDFASGSLEAVKRAASSVEDVQRLRQPRFLRSDNVVRAYSAAEAMGNKLLKEIEKGKYASTDIYEHLETIIDKQIVLLLSNHRVIYATRSDLFGTWTIQWTFLWNEICNIICSESGVLINLKNLNKKVMGMFSKEQHDKLVSIPNPTRRENLAKIMRDLKNKV